MKNTSLTVISILLVGSIILGYTFSVVASPGNGNSRSGSSQSINGSAHSAAPDMPSAGQSSHDSSATGSSGATESKASTPDVSESNHNTNTVDSSSHAPLADIPLSPIIKTGNNTSSRILVRYMSGTTQNVKSNFGKQMGVQKIKEMSNKSWILYGVPKDKIPEEVLRKIREKRGTIISEAEMDVLLPTNTINDPYFSDQWHHKAIGSEEAWAIQPSSSITVAVADTGVDRTHPDLQNGTLLPGFNTVKNNNDDSDTVGHGTSVIGTIAAVGGNGLGVVGTAFQSKILPIKITADGSSSAYLSDIGEAIYYASNAGAKIINISFGPLCTSSYFDDSAAYMKKNGGLVVVAAGNDGTEMPCAATSNVIYVSATDKNNIKTSWSSYGNFVDVAAPGESITTTTVGGGYASVSGTSFSSPIVSGVLALIWSKNPLISNDDVESILKKTAIDRGDTGVDSLYGYGLISSKGALEYMYSGAPENPIIVPGTDTQAPVFTYFSQADGDSIKAHGILSLSTRVTDNVGTTEIVITFDGVVIGKCINTSSCTSIKLNTRKIPKGDHHVVFRAQDAASNVSTQAITMHKN